LDKLEYSFEVVRSSVLSLYGISICAGSIELLFEVKKIVVISKFCRLTVNQFPVLLIFTIRRIYLKTAPLKIGDLYEYRSSKED